MGIRVICPSGHRLNLKSYLAGKTGICPQCQTRFLIPETESDEPVYVTEYSPRAKSDSKTRKRSSKRKSDSAVQTIAPPRVPTQAYPELANFDPHLPNKADAAGSETSESRAPVSAQTSAAPETALIWYLHDPGISGANPEGPMSEKTLRARLQTEEQPLNELLVWQPKWKQWRPADLAFSEIDHLPGENPLATLTAGTSDDAQHDVPLPDDFLTDTPASLGLSRTPRRRRSNDRTKIVTGILGVVILFLTLTFALIVYKQQNPPEAPSPEPADSVTNEA